MSDQEELDKIYMDGGYFAPENNYNSNNDSIENNADKCDEQRKQQLDMFDDNYENKVQQNNGFDLSISNIGEKADSYDKDSIEYRLLNSGSFENYDEALTQYTANMGIYPVERLTQVFKIILDSRKDVTYQLMEFSRNCIFLKDISRKLKQIENADIYKEALQQLFKPSQNFYTYNIDEDSLQILNIYLQEENPDFGSINEFVNEYFQNQMKSILTNPESHLFRYIHKLFLQSSLRKGKPLFNLFLILKADKNDKDEYLNDYQDYFLIKSFAQLDRKEIQEYLKLLLQVCDASQLRIQKYVFPAVRWLLHESQNIEKKLLGFRVINDLVNASRSKEEFKYMLVNWLTENKILQIFLRDSTHSRILQQIQPIIHFLYEAGIMADSDIIQLMKISLHSQEIFKVVQSMLGWLKLKHLFLIFQIVPHSDPESTLFINFLSSLLSNPLIADDGSRKRKNYIIQDNRKEIEPEMQVEIEEEVPEDTQTFVKKLLHLLISLVVQNQNNFMPILLKLISSHSRIFKPELGQEIIKLLRNGSVCVLWIIEHWLKIETVRDRGHVKYAIISKLAGDGVFQLMLALLARNRFSRPVVDKALAVIIIFCRANKPLEKSITQFLWKVLGTTARDQKQRQQFFVFLKELVRYERSITEESVNFIFFDLLMSLVGGWFSLRVYDCLQMLFLRLNQDCKLLVFERDQYKIVKEPLVGMDKFIYIYFNCTDLKVVKKCRDFLCKLIVNAEDTKEAMYMYIIENLKKHMSFAIEMNKPDEATKRQVIILRVFELAEKLSLQKEKIQQTKESMINLHLQITNMYTLGAKTSTLEVNEKLTLADLKAYIGDNLNPPQRNIELWTKGNLLKGENLNLKQLKLENNQTISVTKAEPMEVEEDKDQKKRQQLDDLTAIAEGTDPQFLKYIINKFEGQNFETIVNNFFDPDLGKALQEEFNEKKFQKEEVIIQVENIKQKTRNFGTLLVHEKDIFEMLLQCLRQSQGKTGGWNFIKKLPLNEAYVVEVTKYMESGRWQQLFIKRDTQHALYIIHIISNRLKQCPEQIRTVFEAKGLRMYLINWLSVIVKEQPEELLSHQDLLKLLLMEVDCPYLTLFDEFLKNKAMSEKDYQIIPRFDDLIQKSSKRWQFGLSIEATSSMIECLLNEHVSERLANLIAKIYILQIVYPTNRNQFYSILAHSKLELLLLKYGKPLEFMVIATALHLNSQNNQNFLPKFTFKLLSTFRKTPHEKGAKYSYFSFFSCLIELLSISAVFDSSQELRILTEILNQVMKDIGSMQQEQVIGYFKISVSLLDRHFKADRGGQRKNEDIYKFAVWLFNQYLFGINKQPPHFTSKHLRKAAYQLLIKMCGYGAVLKMIAQSVRQLMKVFKDSNEVEGDIRTSNKEFIGIRNLGATCYVNSLLQQLYHTSFPTLLLEDDNEDNSTPIKLLQLKKIFTQLYCGIRSPVYPNDYVDTVKINGEYVRPMVQQDVNEFFASLMHQVEQAVGSKPANQTICGTLSHQIRGLQEGSQIKNVDQTFLTLMIDIKNKKNLLQALGSLSKPHFLQGENMYYSQVLHKKIRAQSRTYLGKLPNILVITLKRFYWNFQQMNRIKINDYFEFPLQLDLSRFAMQGRKETDPHYFDYKLCGIIIHSGSAESGHYYSFIEVGQKWLEFNDRKVTEWDMQNNLKNECFGNDQKSRNAYMLFYQRVDSQAHGCSLNKLPQTNRLIQMAQQENQNFILNRLIYDSNYIDFIKELSRFENYKSILTVLDSLKHYRQTPQVYLDKPTEDQQKKKKPEVSQLEKIEEEEEKTPLLQGEPQHVTFDQVKQLAARHFPNTKVDQTTQVAKDPIGQMLMLQQEEFPLNQPDSY